MVMAGLALTLSGWLRISSSSEGDARRSSRWVAANRRPDMACPGGFVSRFCLLRPLLSMPRTYPASGVTISLNWKVRGAG